MMFACEDENIASKITRLVSGWHFKARAHAPDGALTIHLSLDAAPPMPARPPDFPVHHGECFRDGNALVLATGDSRMRIGPTALPRVDVWIGPETARSPVSFARLLFYAAQAALRRGGLFELHAAGVRPPATPENPRPGGVLIAGASGSGKTTLTMRLTAAGWSSVGDDLVLIREDPAAAEAFAFRRVFAATETTLDTCPPPGIDEALREPNAFEPDKRRLDPEVLFPGRFAASCTPDTLVFPVITRATETTTRPIASPEALTRLVRMCPWAAYDTAVARPHLSALARLARQCRSYELLAGTDLLHDREAAPRVFRSLAGSAQ